MPQGKKKIGMEQPEHMVRAAPFFCRIYIAIQ
ncbi:hypothetical protein KM92DES2_12640 [uncultured Desulfovibrio sp.]|uniref:Uncharacterized protein n=1 Tax=uncultured Desulfovibrio sp. TaxID=167968 RepID=A0A212KC19_9BACT|nr:hypothetical protein KM92DES2_12640 [uncultured Desulfovibrio sp.]